MKKFQLQHKLALLIAFLTAALTSVGVIIGISTLRSNVTNSAIDDAFMLSTGLSQDVVATETIVIEESINLDESSLGVSEAEVVDFTEYESTFLRSAVFEYELFEKLNESFGKGNEVKFLLDSGQIVAINENQRVRSAEYDGESPVILASSIFANIGNPFIDQVPQLDEKRELATASRFFDGRELGVIVDVTEEMRALDKVSTRLWISVVILTLLSGVASWYLINRSLSPVAAITKKVALISAGDLDQRVPNSTKQDEIGVLAETMNSMLSRLEVSDQQRRQFIADASHELRTPVAVMQSEVELFQKTHKKSSAANMTKLILRETERLKYIIDDLLTLAMIDERTKPEKNQVLDFDEIVFEQTNRNRGMRIDRSQVSAGKVRANKRDIDKIVNHLLNNACRHATSLVRVGVSSVKDKVNFFIEDDGCGISVEDRKRIFERFARLDEARSRDGGGAGLGLAVVFEIINKYHGDILVTDSQLGGARFDIFLPKHNP